MKIVIDRGGTGIGDALMTTPVIRLLAEQGHTVDALVRANPRLTLANNPHINLMRFYPKRPDNIAECRAFRKWQEHVKAEYDRVIDLGYTVEQKFLHGVDGRFGSIPDLETRRRNAEGHNYYDSNLEKAGLEPRPVLPELYASEKEQENLAKVARDMKEAGTRMVVWNHQGSTMNKTLTRIGRWIRAVHDRLDDTTHFLVGHDPVMIPDLPRSGRVFTTETLWQLRDALLFTSIADLVVGPESAIVNAAACFDTPKLILYSHSDPDNLGRYYINHYPVRPKCECHPCYLIPYNFTNLENAAKRKVARKYQKACTQAKFGTYRHVGFRCVTSLDDEEVIETAVIALEKGRGTSVLRAVGNGLNHDQG